MAGGASPKYSKNAYMRQAAEKQHEKKDREDVGMHFRHASSLALGFCLLVVAPAWAQEKTVKVGTEGDYPRFSYTDTAGNLAGWDIDLVNAVCAEAKLKCEFVRQAFDGMIPALLAGKIDAVSSINITDERRKVIAFTAKHYNIPYRWVARKGVDFQPTQEWLKGKIIGVQSGTIQERYVHDNFGGVAEIKLYKKQDDANLDLIAERIDATIAQELVITEDFLATPEGQAFQTYGNSVDDPKWFGEGTAIAVRKDDDELREKFNAGIRTIRANGTYAKINAKHFPIDIYGSD